MARPKSDTVDYFTHDVDASTKKTLTIIEGQFGVSGYAFWYKLLEWLGGSCEGHYFDGRKPTDLEFLERKCGSDVVSGTGILQKLAELGAIDPILWEHRVVWSQNFVDRLADVYKKRGRSLPQKPSFCNGNCNHIHMQDTISGTETKDKGLNNDVSSPEMPQRKGNNSKGNNSIVTPVAPLNDIKEIITIYEQEIGMLTPMISEEIKLWLTEYPLEHIKAAIKEASRAGVRKVNYIEKILESWKVNGFKAKGGHKSSFREQQTQHIMDGVDAEETK
jgi:DnaD/phage-associated family protein